MTQRTGWIRKDIKAQVSTDSTAPPVISNIQVSNITSDGATITWTTNQPSNSVVEYGTTTSYGSSRSNSAQVTNHSITLTDLLPNTTYNYRVKSTNANGTATSTNYTFTTLPQEDEGGEGSITIDGNFSDWSGITAYATDAQDMGGGSGDAKALTLESGNGNLYARLDVYGNFSMSTVNILYLDTDNNELLGCLKHPGQPFSIQWRQHRCFINY